jgi:teichuronic acid biosynthesis glycosyltransferase TuaC
VRVLAITQLFPSSVEPLSSPFNRQQFAALGQLCDLEVLAPVPYFPGARLLGDRTGAGRLRGAPRHERIAGLEVSHPRTLHLPRVIDAAAPLYAASLLPAVLRRRGRVDVVLGAWAYPDGCAAIALARLVGAPCVVKLHGSDMNIVAERPGPRRQLAAMLPRAAAVVAVSRPLAERAIALGVAPERVHVVANGVDSERFRPDDRAAARATLGLPPAGRLVLYVGHLKESKGVLDLAAAFAELAPRLAGARLAVVGDGEARGRLAGRLAPLGERALPVGPRPHDEIATWLAACDVLCLPSWNEGTPNVVLEALAAGRRVVATAVGGIPDLVTSERVGELVPPRAPGLLAEALGRALGRDDDPAAIAAAAPRHSWADSAARLHAVLAAVARP